MELALAGVDDPGPQRGLIRRRFLVTFLVALVQNGLAMLYAFGLGLRFHPVAALDAAIVFCEAPFHTITPLIYFFTIILIIRVYSWCLGCECIARKTAKHHNKNNEQWLHTAFHISPSVDAYSFPAFAGFAFTNSSIQRRETPSILGYT